ncbi:MAG: TIGR03560 family F420-dependent LLM class oxidoreductase [Acidobacteria bacterium]|nr:TIGR03560 family F420-dependent LLM class oxidoreductase [Acidobacteriota bacterium]
MSGLHIGTIVPQGWKGEFEGLGAREAHRTMIGVAERAERLGYDSVWLYDHFHSIPPPARPTPVFECWTSMMALAGCTERVRIGQMVTCVPYRNPAYLAKVSSCVDVASGGRLEMGMGAGWYQDEFDAYGYGFPRAKDRIEALEDAVEILKRMWTEERATYEGRHSRVRGALCDPKPLQPPRPPLWIGGSGRRKTLRVVARHADWSNFVGGSDFAGKRDALAAHCEAVGRDPAEVRLSLHVECVVAPSDAEVERALDHRARIWGRPTEEWRAAHLVGTPGQVADQARAFAAMGASGFVLWFPDFPSTEGLDLFAAEVLPALRGIP